MSAEESDIGVPRLKRQEILYKFACAFICISAILFFTVFLRQRVTHSCTEHNRLFAEEPYSRHQTTCYCRGENGFNSREFFLSFRAIRTSILLGPYATLNIQGKRFL